MGDWHIGGCVLMGDGRLAECIPDMRMVIEGLGPPTYPSPISDSSKCPRHSVLSQGSLSAQQVALRGHFDQSFLGLGVEDGSWGRFPRSRFLGPVAFSISREADGSRGRFFCFSGFLLQSVFHFSQSSLCSNGQSCPAATQSPQYHPLGE